MESYGKEVVLVEVNIGNKSVNLQNLKFFCKIEPYFREAWADRNNSFRTDKNTRLVYVPTLLRWDETDKALVGGEIADKKEVEWLFE